MTATELNALIGSRICHDLISPLGAIGNGIELLTMSGMSAAPEITLISESVDNANARIRFFRIAFGAASADAVTSHSEVTGILADVYRGILPFVAAMLIMVGLIILWPQIVMVIPEALF